MIFILNQINIKEYNMARKKVGPKPMKSRKSGIKTAKRIAKNNEILKKLK
jgi:DNA/RNA-binding domain of Phe-tRNA-synthetase-like protein